MVIIQRLQPHRPTCKLMYITTVAHIKLYKIIVLGLNAKQTKVGTYIVLFIQLLIRKLTTCHVVIRDH